MMPGASEDDAGELPWADAGNLAVNDKIAKHIRRYFLKVMHMHYRYSLLEN